VLVTPPLDAVMLACPAGTPRTTPSTTVATAGFDEVQVNGTPDITAPYWSRAWAASVWVRPTPTFGSAGVTAIEASAAATATAGASSAASPPLRPPPQPSSNEAVASNAAAPHQRPKPARTVPRGR